MPPIFLQLTEATTNLPIWVNLSQILAIKPRLPDTRYNFDFGAILITATNEANPIHVVELPKVILSCIPQPTGN